MQDNFTYLRFKQMIMHTYIIELECDFNDPTLIKHLDLLRCRFDPNAFTLKTIGEYRINLFTQLQREVEDWLAYEQIGSMNS